MPLELDNRLRGIMHSVQSIPTQDIIAMRDLVGSCDDALQCIYMALQSLPNKECNAINCVLTLATDYLESLKELLNGEVSNA